ncbi:hypothetical protein BRARA_C03344 [Brassica rapa]|uniref:Uncharacterized protein n=1 Tax=Brassica campestris TaxID=3711 RepID=A0A398A418_BRACM|nr:hypothetical protein BRARA_C03344 [Brassica rapa]
METIEMSRTEVIVYRGIWYIMTLLSLFGLSIPLNLLWPPGGKSPALSRFLTDGAVSATRFYAVAVRLTSCFYHLFETSLAIN